MARNIQGDNGTKKKTDSEFRRERTVVFSLSFSFFFLEGEPREPHKRGQRTSATNSRAQGMGRHSTGSRAKPRKIAAAHPEETGCGTFTKERALRKRQDAATLDRTGYRRATRKKTIKATEGTSEERHASTDDGGRQTRPRARQPARRGSGEST